MQIEPILVLAVDRVVLVDHEGLHYEKQDVAVRLDFQDDGKTLKVFVHPRYVEKGA